MRGAARARVLVGTGLAAAVWAASLACVPHPSPDPTCDGSTVTGLHAGVFVAPSGEQPRPFKALPANALLPLPGTGRGYKVCNGNDDGMGHVTIAGVPEDFKYYFQLGTTYVETIQRNVDFTDYFLGRPDAVPAKTATQVTLQASNLEPWSSQSDAIGVYSWGARTYHFGVENLGSGAPSDGATSMTLSFDWSQLLGQRLLDASKGDQLLVTQYAQRSVSGGTAQVAVKQLTLSNATLKDGQSASLSGTFSDLTLSRSFSVNWARSAFDALALDTAPDATSTSQSFFVEAEPGGAMHGHYDFSLDLFETGFSASGATDRAISGSVANLSGFSNIVELSEDLPVVRLFHGAAETVNAFIFVEDLLDHADRNTVSPATGPVKSPKIAGNDGFTPQSGVGTTPVVSWTPGLATEAVRVLVCHMITQSSGTVGHEVVATLFTGESSVQIPDGILKSGETYYLFLDAMASGGAKFDQAPFKTVDPTTIVRVVTETFTP